MKRTLNRQLTLNEDEVSEAIKYWLVNKHDIQIGTNPRIEFEDVFTFANVLSYEDDTIALDDTQ